MRTLVIMRHAKAERGDGKPDFDRRLEPRGVREADAVGARLAGLGLAPDLVLCSTSRRTRDTLAALLPYLPGDSVVHLRRTLYDADVAGLREAVRGVSADCVLMIGHNPSVHGFAVELAAGNTAGELAGGFPTSTAAVFALRDDGDARLEGVVRP